MDFEERESNTFKKDTRKRGKDQASFVGLCLLCCAVVYLFVCCIGLDWNGGKVQSRQGEDWK